MPGVAGPLSYADLAAAGLALDICGAGIVARGLFQSKREIVELATTEMQLVSEDNLRRSTGELIVGHPTILLSRVEDRVDGTIGLVMLCVGFLAQGAAAVASAGSHISNGTPAKLLLSGGVLIVSIIVAAIVYRAIRPTLVRRMLGAVLREPGIHPQFADSVRRLHRDPRLRERPHTVRR
jgi:hypothetical protein